MHSFIREIKTIKAILFHKAFFEDAFVKYIPDGYVSDSSREYSLNLIVLLLSNYQKLKFMAKELLPKYKETSDEAILVELVIASILRKKKSHEEIRKAFEYTAIKKDMKIKTDVIFRKLTKMDILNYFDKSELRDRLSDYEIASLDYEVPTCLVKDIDRTYEKEVALQVIQSLRSDAYPVYIFNPRKGDEYSLVKDERFEHFSLGAALCYRPIIKEVFFECESLNLIEINLIQQVALSNIDIDKSNVKIAICGCETSVDVVPALLKSVKSENRIVDALFNFPNAYDMFYNEIVNETIPGLTIYFCQRSGIKTTLVNHSYDYVLSQAYGNSTGICEGTIEILPSLNEKNFNDCLPSIMDNLSDDALLVKDGGTLIYLSSSISDNECRDVIKQFLASHVDFTLEKDSYVLKNDYSSYGGYYAVLRKKKDD